MKELAQLTSAIDEILAMDTTAPSVHNLTATVQVLARQASRLQAAIAAHTSAAQDANHGQLDIAAFLTRQCHYSGRDAARLMRVSTRLTDALPHTFSALRRGDITWTHALTVVRAENDLGPEHVVDHEETWIQNVANQSGPERLQRLVRALMDEQGRRCGPGREPETFETTPQFPDHDPDSRADISQDESPKDVKPELGEPVTQEPSILTLIRRAALEKDSAIPTTAVEAPSAAGVQELAAPPGENTASDANSAHISETSVSEQVTATSEPSRHGLDDDQVHCLHEGCENSPQWYRLRHTIRWPSATETIVGLIVPICRLHREGIDGNDITVVAVPQREQTRQLGQPGIAA